MHFRRWLLIACCACSAAAQDRGPLDLANAPVPPGVQRIAWGSEPLQFGELRLPEGPGPHPVAIVVHGGCWAARLEGLDERAIAIDNMRPLAAALAAAGIATWNIEYRRLGHAGGGWPGTFRDVARAADFLRTLAREHPLDLGRVVSIGHSAGGHLALWLAARAAIPPDSELYEAAPLPLAGAVSLDGPADLAAMIPLQQTICRTPVITDLLGGSPEERPERYRAAAPIEMLERSQSFEFLAGRMFAAQAESFATRARTHGADVRITVLANAGHFVFIDPESAVWPQVLQGVQRLLSRPTPAAPLRPGVVAPGQLFPGSYLEVRAPASAGWRLAQSSGSGMMFARAGRNSRESCIAQVSMFALEPTGTAEEFTALVRKLVERDTDPDRFDVQQISFNYVDKRPYACVRYHSVVLDRSPPGRKRPLLLETDGLYCRHPRRTETGFAVLYSHRGEQAHVDQQNEAESFIRGIQVPGE